ncbi:MAG: hypothetical protein PHW55_11805, partial [Methanothrix sp.]|nr:hypothetical protein [Methanothrix sp.]
MLLKRLSRFAGIKMLGMNSGKNIKIPRTNSGRNIRNLEKTGIKKPKTIQNKLRRDLTNLLKTGMKKLKI